MSEIKLECAYQLQESAVSVRVGEQPRFVPSINWIQSIQDRALETAARKVFACRPSTPDRDWIARDIRSLKNKRVDEEKVKQARSMVEQLERLRDCLVTVHADYPSAVYARRMIEQYKLELKESGGEL
ncbi:MAG: hypothetical protein O7D91_17630 [Planctomycetota bacterium]|nr:hypothetical protein [Planctomycetota bacterium]